MDVGPNRLEGRRRPLAVAARALRLALRLRPGWARTPCGCGRRGRPRWRASVQAACVRQPGRGVVRSSNGGSNAPETPRNVWTPPDMKPWSMAVCPSAGARRDTPEDGVVELEGIEPSSAKRSTSALRPFPRSRHYGWRTAGSEEHAGCSPPGLSLGSAVFPAVSGLSLRSAAASVAGLQRPGPVCRHRSLVLSTT